MSKDVPTSRRIREILWEFYRCHDPLALKKGHVDIEELVYLGVTQGVEALNNKLKAKYNEKAVFFKKYKFKSPTIKKVKLKMLVLDFFIKNDPVLLNKELDIEELMFTFYDVGLYVMNRILYKKYGRQINFKDDVGSMVFDTVKKEVDLRHKLYKYFKENDPTANLEVNSSRFNILIDLGMRESTQSLSDKLKEKYFVPLINEKVPPKDFPIQFSSPQPAASPAIFSLSKTFGAPLAKSYMKESREYSDRLKAYVKKMMPTLPKSLQFYQDMLFERGIRETNKELRRIFKVDLCTFSLVDRVEDEFNGYDLFLRLHNFLCKYVREMEIYTELVFYYQFFKNRYSMGTLNICLYVRYGYTLNEISEDFMSPTMPLEILPQSLKSKSLRDQLVCYYRKYDFSKVLYPKKGIEQVLKWTQQNGREALDPKVKNRHSQSITEFVETYDQLQESLFAFYMQFDRQRVDFVESITPWGIMVDRKTLDGALFARYGKNLNDIGEFPLSKYKFDISKRESFEFEGSLVPEISLLDLTAYFSVVDNEVIETDEIERLLAWSTANGIDALNYNLRKKYNLDLESYQKKRIPPNKDKTIMRIASINL